MMDRHRANVGLCSNNNVMPISEKMKDNTQPLSFGEIPSFDLSQSMAPLTGLRVVAFGANRKGALGLMATDTWVEGQVFHTVLNLEKSVRFCFLSLWCSLLMRTSPWLPRFPSYSLSIHQVANIQLLRQYIICLVSQKGEVKNSSHSRSRL